jgi:hypothetical protein
VSRWLPSWGNTHNRKRVYARRKARNQTGQGEGTQLESPLSEDSLTGTLQCEVLPLNNVREGKPE